MFNYVIKDLVSACRYLPYAMVFTAIVAMLIWMINRRRRKGGKKPVAMVSTTFFVAYGLLVLLITFLSREEGGNTGMYLKLFSSFGINNRNNAYIIENILLFVPLGLAGAWLGVTRSCFVSVLFGVGYSFLIESLQYVTGRGVFQLDDILTNTVGMLLGCLLYKVCNLLFKRRG